MLLRKMSKLLLIAVLGCVIPLMSGCVFFGYAASAIPKSADAQYKGLAGQKVAVMVWAERSVRIDYPNLQLDTGNGIQALLLAKTKEDTLKKTQFPYEVRSVLRFQKEHPELESHSVTEWAHRMSGVTRLIFVEISDFTTRGGSAVQLLRGTTTANVKVLEIGGKSSKIVYEKQNIQLSFPPKSPEGVIDVPESKVYAGTVQSVSRTIAELFYPHVIED